MADSKWLSRYREGSYEGSKFFMDSHNLRFGRGKVVHEFPGRDDAEIEDTGKLPKRFNLNVYILADDYFSERDTLINKIEERKKGLLVHPYLGTYTVQILDASAGEAWDQGRMVRFRLDAIQDSEKTLTSTVVDTQFNILDKQKTFLESAFEFFDDAYNVTQGPIDFVNGLINTVDQGINLISAAKKTVKSVASYQQKLDQLVDRVDQLIFNSEDLFNEFSDLIGFGTVVSDEENSQTSPSASRDQYFEMQNIADDNTVNSDLEDPNTLIQYMFLLNAIGYMSGLLATVEYDSQDDAEILTKILYDLIDFISEDINTSTEVKDAIINLKDAIYFDTQRRTDGLGVVYNYDVKDESVPSLVLSNTIYGDISKEQDLVNRNVIENPFFIGGKITAVVNNE